MPSLYKMIDSIIIKINNSNYTSILEFPNNGSYRKMGSGNTKYNNLTDNYIYVNENENITKLCKIPIINIDNLTQYKDIIDNVIICVINKFNRNDHYYVPISIRFLGLTPYSHLNTIKPSTHNILELVTSSKLLKYFKLTNIDVNYLSIVYFFPDIGKKDVKINPIIFDII